MFIHFRKLKEYGVSLMQHTIGELEKTGEEAYCARMMGIVRE
jgi:hypothetical protein